MTDLLFLGDLRFGEAAAPVIGPGLSQRLRDAQLVCCNFEAPLPCDTASRLPKAGPHLEQTADAVAMARSWGITHFSLANNHIMDGGSGALKFTLDAIGDTAGMGAGLDMESAYQPRIIRINGQQIALMAVAEAQFGAMTEPGFPGYAWVGHPLTRDMVRRSAEQYDLVIVQVHAGLEMVELPLPEWRSTYRELIDLGADLVLAHHPHVVQGMERYRDKEIFFSLGNFWMSGMSTGSGAVLSVEVTDGGLTSTPLMLNNNDDTRDIDDDSLNEFEQLSRKLSDPGYLEEIDNICLVLWEEVYAPYYQRALMGTGLAPSSQTFLKLLRRLVAYFRRPTKVYDENRLLLLHNLSIESHRWAVERALRVLETQASINSR